MGITSSRTFLYKPPEPRKSEVYPRPDLKPFFETHRLVRNELLKETQRRVSHQRTEARNSISVIQVAPEGLQQEDVRSLLSKQTNQVSGNGHNSRPTELL